jgi:hypothetical protein
VVLLVAGEDGTPLGAPTVSTGAKLALEIEAEPPFSLFAWVFAPDLLAPSCPVAIGGEGAAIPRGGEFWRASVVDADEPALFTLSESPAIDVKTTCTVPLPCPSLAMEEHRLDPLAGGNLAAILPLSPVKALLANDQSRRILELDGDRTRLLDTGAISGPIRSLAREGNTIYGATRTEVFRFEIDDEVLEVETSTVQRGLELVPSGPPVVYGPFGIREVFTAASGTTAVERAMLDVRHVRMAAADLGLLVDEMSMIYAFAGVAWTPDSPGANAFTFESFRRLGGDESSFMAVGKRENAFLRRAGVWEQLPPPFNRGIGLSDVAALGGDRFFVVGEFGAAALYQDGIWCTYELTPERNLHRVARSEDPQVLFVGTNPDAGGVPSLLRVTLR